MFEDPDSIPDISIRAPARGATLTTVSSAMIVIYFNPRSREGSDVSVLNTSETQRHFNPRSREGSDISFSDKTSTVFISIRAPAKGATGRIDP